MYIHWLSQHPLYDTFYSINERCYNIDCKSYPYYWKRGIINEWESLQSFINDMYSTHKKGLQLDRINNDWNYSKLNCRWVTPKENSKNRKNTFLINWIPLATLCEQYNMPHKKVYNRIVRYNWAPEKALTTPIRICKTSNS